ncbi:hypothetical protein MLD38_011268 [Melastoma candidum]|uniref:Uncharacterized protein n=1 Tax=Melastoma candidum TaxID=119954 RepID=A0ACB9R4A1_9MYRT|nr:hypothetical protein MLD38_011268 [Melastoma candidum]
MDNGTSPLAPSPSNNSVLSSHDQQGTGGFAYGIGISLGVLILIVLLSLISYVCMRLQLTPREAPITPIHRYSFPFSASVHRQDRSSSLEAGLDDNVLGKFPEFPYSQAKDHSRGGDSCSICLTDYREGDSLRQLPDCGHTFHVKCVDPWLRAHPTCPVCRSSPVPSPLPSPLAEVTPFTARLS